MGTPQDGKGTLPTSSEDGQQQLRAHFLKCKDKTELCDFIILCGPEHSWKVHKLVVCPQSDFLDKAAFGPFKEGASAEVDLSAFATPETVARLVHYFYHQDYDDTNKTRDLKDAVYLVCTEDDTRPITVNAEMFIIAEQLGMHALKACATQKTSRCFANGIWWSDLGRAVRLIYEFTPPGERKIRQVYVDMFRIGRTGLFKRSDCEEKLIDMVATPQFLVDVSRTDTSVLETLARMDRKNSEYIHSAAGLPGLQRRREPDQT